MNTTREIAEMLGVSKMTVYRYIKQESISETSQRDRTLLYDDTTTKLIIKGFKSRNDIKKATENVTPDMKIELLENNINDLKNTINLLREQLKIKDNQLDKKDNQIEQLQKLMDQQQQLSLSQKMELLEQDTDTKKSFFSFFKK